MTQHELTRLFKTIFKKHHVVKINAPGTDNIELIRLQKMATNLKKIIKPFSNEELIILQNGIGLIGCGCNTYCETCTDLNHKCNKIVKKLIEMKVEE